MRISLIALGCFMVVGAAGTLDIDTSANLLRYSAQMFAGLLLAGGCAFGPVKKRLTTPFW